MKSLRYAMLLSLVVLVLSSCTGLPPVTAPTVAAPTAEAPAARAPEPAAATEVVTTAAPAVAATAAITTTAPVTTTAPSGGATPTNEQVMGPNPLVGVAWEWAAFIKTKPPTQLVVPNPASYTLAFNGDGTIAIKADCNSATASYTLVNDQLTIKPGATTLVACQPGSQGDAMLKSLAKVTSYLIDGGDLVLRLGDTGDSMLFRNGGGSPAAPAAPSAPATEATPTPAAAAAATEAPAGAAAPEASQLVGTTWQWEQFVDVATGKKNVDVKNPALYTVMFAADGKVAMQADCNRAVGTYKANGTKLTIEVGPVTLAACGAGSLTDAFLINLTSAAGYKIEGGKLTVDLMADGGRMVFGAAK